MGRGLILVPRPFQRLDRFQEMVETIVDILCQKCIDSYYHADTLDDVNSDNRSECTIID